MSQEPERWLDRLVAACFSLLFGALALYGAVWLIEAMWWVLLIILGVGLLLGGVIAVLRARLRGW